jgi:hypothetical protein
MKHPSENSSQEVLAGLVETYHNVENGFCVLRAKARGHRDVVPATGANTYPQPQPARQRPLLGTLEMGRSAASPAQQHTADATRRRRDRPCGRQISRADAATLSRLAYRWRPTQQLRQLGDVHRQPPRPRRASAHLVAERCDAAIRPESGREAEERGLHLKQR